MLQFIVTAEKLNRRRFIPSKLPEPDGISGTVTKGFRFSGLEVTEVPNPALGKWYRDRQNNFYWGGAVQITDPLPDPEEENPLPDQNILDQNLISQTIKRKIVQVVNVFETGSAEGRYDLLVKYRDYTDPLSRELKVQITFGRSQTTEFGHLKALIEDYVALNGLFSVELQAYLNRLGKQPSLASDDVFCTLLRKSAKEDPLMRLCQDNLFEQKYYQPAYQWFKSGGLTQPLSLLVVYDSTIHSGSIPGFLRNRFSSLLPVHGGDEKKWITDYVRVRHQWLAHHRNTLLQATIYRTTCFSSLIDNENWQLNGSLLAHGVEVQ